MMIACPIWDHEVKSIPKEERWLARDVAFVSQLARASAYLLEEAKGSPGSRSRRADSTTSLWHLLNSEHDSEFCVGL